ncbi:carbonic anhydrase IV c [Salminus brasiliensis]|uniref:carbonic anhydrase IV c n=1 Tax=Salminus brasiliensis TaxID=930266 RepID=UPI003B837A24
MSSTLLISCLFLAPYLCLGQWCYQSQYSCDDKCKEPRQWVLDFPVCGGQSQSPINIITRKVQYDPSLTPIMFEGYTDVMNITVNNVGYAAVFSLPPSVRISGGGLPDTYKAVQFHIHWGSNCGPGSEHTVDGEQYPMEVHIVHIKEKYNTLMEAMNDTVGVAALGFFFEISPRENKQLNKIIDALGRVRYNGNSTEIPGFQLVDFLISLENFSSYYRYAGSLTTPGCNEAIIWTLFQQSIPVSQEQLAVITQQMLFSTGMPMIDIFRPVLSLNSRIVYTSQACPCVLSGLITLLLGLLSVFELV